LKVGDQCPNFKFGKMINYSKPTSELNDFKGKLVIIDFWATWCGPCVDALPKLDSLQQKYKNQLMILPSTPDLAEKVSSFIRNSKKLKNLKLPSIVENIELKKFFPHKVIPHDVWIDGNGVLLAITAAEEINEKNIEKYLHGQQITVKQKKDMLGVNFEKPLLFDGIKGKPGPIAKDKLLSSSLILEFVEGLGSADGSPMVNDSTAMIKCTNSQIESLYQTAFGTTHKSPLPEDWSRFDYSLRRSSRLIWEAKDSSLYYWWGRDIRSLTIIPPEKMYFTYELVLPRKDSLKLNQYMVQDLNRYFGDRLGIEGVKEKRTVKCWVLKRTGSKDLIATKGGKPDFRMDVDTERLMFKNVKMNEFLFWWQMIGLDRYPIPIVNETGYIGSIDLDLKANPTDIESVRKAIQKYGLDLVLDRRELDMIVIKDKK